MKTKLILIGGVPGTGKTTIAYSLALKLGIDKVISTDVVKAVTKLDKAKSYQKNSNKYIFTTTHEAYTLENLSVIAGYLKHSRVINEIILKLINNIKDNIVIIEGSTLNKEFLNMIDKNNYDVIYINLTLSPDELINRYKKKEKIRKSNWIENINVIEEIDEYLKEESASIDNKNLENTLERIINYVKEILYV